MTGASAETSAEAGKKKAAKNDHSLQKKNRKMVAKQEKIVQTITLLLHPDVTEELRPPP